MEAAAEPAAPPRQQRGADHPLCAFAENTHAHTHTHTHTHTHAHTHTRLNACASLRRYGPGEWPTSYTYKGKFPAGFVWGLGTASYQVEGAYKDDGRGASIWDTFTGADTVGMPGSVCSQAPCPVNEHMVAKGDTGNVACDQYHKYKDDVKLMAAMGLKWYRFSVAWPRVVPTGDVNDGVNEKGLQYYSDLVDELIANGITPAVCVSVGDACSCVCTAARGTPW